MSEERDARMRADFQQRRRLWLWWQGASFVVLLGGVGLGWLFEDGPKGPRWIALVLVVLGTAGLSLASRAVKLCCPRCDNYVGRGDGPLDPKACEDCGFQFK